MDLERIKERLVKMKAMAERGVGGERDAADRLLRGLAAKYGISLDRIGSEAEREYTVSATTSWQVLIFNQLLGLMRIEQYGDRHVDKLWMSYDEPRVRRGRKRYYTVCTDAQWLELSAKYEVLCRDYRKLLRSFPLAFLMKNDMLMPYDPDTPQYTPPDEEYEAACRLATGIEASRLHRQLEMKGQE